MEKLLRLLSDYQLFSQNEHLGELIAETERRYSSGTVMLNIDELELNAAGEPFSPGSEDEKI